MTVGAAASLLIVVVLWASNGGLTSLLDGATIFTSLGRLSGLVAADLC